MFNKSIKATVMKVIEQRIAKAQQAYETEVRTIDMVAETAKAKAFDATVEDLVGKII